MDEKELDRATCTFYGLRGLYTDDVAKAAAARYGLLLVEEVRLLQNALKPFAELCEWLEDSRAENDEHLLVSDWEVPPGDRDAVTAKMIRVARAVLSEGEDNDA